MKRIFFLLLTVINIYAYDAFIGAKDLKKALDDKHLVIIDVSEDYEKSHIVGSVSFDVESLKQNEKELQEIFSALGINDDSKVVIYGRNTNEDIKNSAFLAFTLISNGFESVGILDGGYMAWVFEYDAFTTTKKTDISEGSIALHDTKLSIGIEYIKNNKDLKLIDARDPYLYYGISNRKDQRYIGHIKGAKSSYYAYKFLKDSTLRAQSDLEKMYKDGFNLEKTDDIVVYGDNAKEAAVEWYIIYKHMGYKNAKLYFNSYKEYVDLDLKTERFKWE